MASETDAMVNKINAKIYFPARRLRTVGMTKDILIKEGRFEKIANDIADDINGVAMSTYMDTFFGIPTLQNKKDSVVFYPVSEANSDFE